MVLGIERIEVLLLIAAVVAMLVRRLHLPYTVGLTFAGIALAFSPEPMSLKLTKDLIFSAFLPPLIFEAAFNMEWRKLRTDFPLLAVLATAGIVVAGGITAAGLHYWVHWPWSSAILFGTLISATDPVSVLATFKEMGVSGRLRLLVEAESLFNDGTVAAIFAVALAAIAGSSVSVSGVMGNFVSTVLGGVLCGLVTGGAVLLLAWRTEDHLVELTFTTIAAYGSFLIAEQLHFSGVLATLAAGILIGNTSSLRLISDRGRQAVSNFWEYAGFVVNSLIFLLIGTQLARGHFAPILTIIPIVIVLVMVGRAVSIYLFSATFARSRWRVSFSHQHVLFWGGLRGALALALVLGLPQNIPKRTEIVAVTFVVVAFSVIVQGLSLTPLLRYLGEIGSKVK